VRSVCRICPKASCTSSPNMIAAKRLEPRVSEHSRRPVAVSSKVPGGASRNSPAAANARNVREEIAKVRSKTVSITILTPGLTRAREAANLRRELLLNAEGGGSFQNAGAGGLGRTGGPAFSVEATLQNQIFLDGKPFYAFTTGAIRSDRKRNAFRNRVGRRVSQ